MKIPKLSLLFILIFINLSCQDNINNYNQIKNIEKNQYGLQVVNSSEQYQQLIRLDSNFRLVNIKEYIPNIYLDIRYATTNNFTGIAVYNKADAYTRLPVIRKLQLVQNELNAKGLGLKIFDGYRPYDITLKFWDLIGDTNYVASPWSGSRHNRGCAIDLTLIDLQTQKELKMPTDFDDFSENAHPNNNNFSEDIINNRKLLIDIMSKYGFTVYPTEWWHFDYNGYQYYPITNISFESLDSLK